MTKRKIVIRILLLVARMIEPGEWAQEIKDLSIHISVWLTEEPKHGIV